VALHPLGLAVPFSVALVLAMLVAALVVTAGATQVVTLVAARPVTANVHIASTIIVTAIIFCMFSCVARVGLGNRRQTDLTIFDCSLRKSATHTLILAASCLLPFFS
jgi:hypothetical protein